MRWLSGDECCVDSKRRVAEGAVWVASIHGVAGKASEEMSLQCSRTDERGDSLKSWEGWSGAEGAWGAVWTRT